MGRLDGRVAIVTGGGSGMGRAASILFASEGAQVVVAEWVAKAGEETVRAVKDAGGEAIFVKADVSKASDAENMVKTAVATYGKLNILYNNAGVILDEGLTVDLTEEIWDKTISINLKGVWLGMKYAIPELLKAGGGSIINTSSQSGILGMIKQSAYSASKGGIISLSRVVAMEYAARKIRVNCIVPGPIATPMMIQFFTPKALDNFNKILPQQRMGEPEEVARVALFLASDESSHVNGQTINVCGGLTSQSPICHAL